MKYNILIGGMAGQGVNTLTDLFQKILQRKGYYTYSHKDYMSRVRGGHNFNQIIVSTKDIHSHIDKVDVILALDEDTIDIHRHRLNNDGLIYTDIDIEDKNFLYFINATDMAKDLGNKILRGSILLGAILKHIGVELDDIRDICIEYLKKDVELNYSALEAGYSETTSYIQLDITDQYKDTILLDGNTAIALGGIIGGLDLYSAYPMAPSTGIMNFLASNQINYDFIVEQAEDEIAAINIALGAAFGGARTMTGSSGGGLSLMVESIGFSSIMELPIVIVDVQRPGPATGLPTRTEQGDLSFVLTASQGEFPRMIISLRDHEDAISQTVRAMNLAEKYKIPIILLSDQYFANATKNIPTPILSSFEIHRNITTSDEMFDGVYKPYSLTQPLAPRLVPGSVNNNIVLADNHEHNELGNITEDIDMRNAQNIKRMNKLIQLKDDLVEPRIYGSESPQYTLIGWGSMDGPIKSAIDILQSENYNIGGLIFGDLWPLPVERLSKISNIANVLINVEQNFTGQLAKLISQETGIQMTYSILKSNGRQLSATEIVENFKAVISNEA